MEPLVIEQIERVLRTECASLDPDSVPLPDAPGLYLTFDRIAKLAEGAKTRLLDRVDQARPGAREGKRSTADWDAEKTGTTPGAARAKLDTSKRLHDQPGVDEALARGELSGEQANAISDAAGADPSAEKRLLHDARSKSVKDLRKECDKVRANVHPDPAARRKAVHARRFARTWTDAEGGRNIHLRGVPEDLAAVEAVAAKYRHLAFEAARRAGRVDPPDAVTYDGYLAFLQAAIGSATTPTPPSGPEPFDLPPAVVVPPKGARIVETKVIVHVDLDTLRRGRTTSGSICHVDGIGPVDPDWIRKQLGDAFLAVVLHDDDGDIRKVVHYGRSPNALQHTALEARGYVCEIPGCDVGHNLEIDHVADWATTRRTILEDLAWHCSHHHDLKTHHGYRLTGPPGNRTWWGPDGQRIGCDRPPDTKQTGREPTRRREPPESAAPPEPGPKHQQLFVDPDAA